MVQSEGIQLHALSVQHGLMLSLHKYSDLDLKKTLRRVRWKLLLSLCFTAISASLLLHRERSCQDIGLTSVVEQDVVAHSHARPGVNFYLYMHVLGWHQLDNVLVEC